MGQTLKREYCDNCGSCDNLITYCDNAGQERKRCVTPDCTRNNTQGPTVQPTSWLKGQCTDLYERKIPKKICEFFNYQSNTDSNGNSYEIANYIQEGKLIAQHIRYLPKQFAWNGQSKEAGFWGMDKWIPTKEKDIVITEGQIDCMSIAKVTDLMQPVVSIPGGISQLRQVFGKFRQYLEGFRSVILCVDNDKAGQAELQALQKSIGNAFKVVKLPLKDANEMLLAFKEEELLEAIHTADYIRPLGLITGFEIDYKALLIPEEPGYKTPFDNFNKISTGIRKGRLYMLGAGTGIGKSTFMRELALFLIKLYPGIKIANLFLEERQVDTINSYIALHNNVPAQAYKDDPTIITDEQRAFSEKLFVSENLMFTTSAFDLTSEELFSCLDYLTLCKKYDIILLDHISILVSGVESSREGERKDIDRLMHKLRSLINKTGVTIIAASHLTDSAGEKSFEEGKSVRLKDFRGSKGIVQLSDVVISLERNTMNELKQSETTLKILKNRVSGRLGKVEDLVFIEKTGRLLSIQDAMR